MPLASGILTIADIKGSAHNGAADSVHATDAH